MQERHAIETISWKEQIIYSSSDIELNICCIMFKSFILYFYTNSILLNAAMAGVMISISGIFDDISNIITNHVINNAKVKNRTLKSRQRLIVEKTNKSINADLLNAEAMNAISHRLYGLR